MKYKNSSDALDSHVVDVESSKYFNDRDHFKDLEDMGCDVQPVDSKFAYVPTTKEDPDNLKKAQANIRKRFYLDE